MKFFQTTVITPSLSLTNYGDRADYRSLDIPSVLKISDTETAFELRRRHREKLEQALENPFGLDAYVVISAFSKSVQLNP